MSALILASAPEDAVALEAAEGHHARLAGELAGRVAMLLTAADRNPGAVEKVRTGLVAFCDREILPHAAAEESVLYPAARALPDSRLLIESLIAEHSCLIALVDALRAATSATGAAADARALQVLFEEHVAKENGLVLPLLAVAPGVRLAALLADLHDRLSQDTPGCGGGLGAGEPELHPPAAAWSVRAARAGDFPAGDHVGLDAYEDPVAREGFAD